MKRLLLQELFNCMAKVLLEYSRRDDLHFPQLEFTTPIFISHTIEISSKQVTTGSRVEVDRDDVAQLLESEAQGLRATYFTSHVSKMTSNCNCNSGGGSYSTCLIRCLTSCKKGLKKKKKKDKIYDSIWTQFLFPSASQKHEKYIKYCEK